MAEHADESSPDIRSKLAEYSVELMRLKKLLDLALGKGARSSRAPEDRVVFPLLVSCRDILEEILFSVNEGFGRAALRSVRTMYECVVTARYLNVHPDKAGKFMAAFHAQWAKVFQNFPSEYRNPILHSTLAANVPKYAQGKWVTVKDLNWSGEHTLGMAKEAGQLANLHSLAFDYASAFVHPSAVFVLSGLSRLDPSENVLQVSMKPQDEEAKLALLIAHDLALNAVDLRLKYSPSDALRKRFDSCKADFLRIWEFPPHF